MASTLVRQRFPFGALVAIAVLALATAVSAQAQAQVSAGSRVRAADRKAAALLSLGIARSPTVAALVETLDDSDVFVHVATGLAQALDLRGKCGALTINADTPAGRYLRVSIVVPATDADLLAALAHELQHAAEVASAPGVRDASSLLQFYKERGFCRPDGRYCTREAVAAGLTARRNSARAAGPPLSLPTGRLARSMRTR